MRITKKTDSMGDVDKLLSLEEEASSPMFVEHAIRDGRPEFLNILSTDHQNRVMKKLKALGKFLRASYEGFEDDVTC